ncbi:MAG: hypothetical protein COA57_04735 [Flavobacteriales bacterium]|nr:MAG: hypothetical protein COA57_04735 [Flavobacteriales bacterium]
MGMVLPSKGSYFCSAMMRFIFMLFFACVLARCGPPKESLLVCDAEKVVKKDSGKYFKCSGDLFSDGNFQSDEHAYSGNYSVKLDKEHPFGMTWIDEDVQPSNYYQVRVKRYGKQNTGFLVLALSETSKLYLQEKYPAKKLKNGWELLWLEAHLPPHLENKKVKIYCWNPDTIPVWFDDLEIVKEKEKTYPDFKQVPSLNITISPKNLQKIEQARYAAFLSGTLHGKKWLKATIVYQGNEIPVKVRLKGDWLDHLQGNKWSFRIKMQGENTWNRMEEFSIQNPKTRDFLHEWVLHKFLEKEDVLTTRYEFVPVKLNGKSLGIYAYEEHFLKHLLENQKRREGPILKFNEDGFWESIRYNEEDRSHYYYRPFFEAAEILPFKKNRTLKDSALYKQFLIAQNLMLQYKQGLTKVSDVFDLEKMAKYYAIVDITAARHGFIWHNQRFYYNPVTSKLEPIVFDGYSGNGLNEPYEETISGYSADCKAYVNDKYQIPLYALFHDTLYVHRYIHYLKKYAAEEYISTLQKELQEEIENYETLILQEYPFAQYNWSFLTNNAKKVSQLLSEYRKQLQTCYPTFSFKEKKVDPCNGELPFPTVAVKAYIKKDKQNTMLLLANYHCADVEITGVGNNSIELLMDATLPAFSGKETYAYHEISSNNYKTVFYRVKGLDIVFTTSILQWPKPNGFSFEQRLFSTVQINKHLFSKKGNTLLLKPGKHTVSEDVIIPKEYTVIFEKGTELNLVNGSKFISKSPIRMNGTEQMPIIISSKDGTGSFTVLQGNDTSILKHVVFEGLNTLDYKGWTLTGAVTFYESDVLLDNCHFTSNKCEDALNIIRSNFKMENCIFENAPGDAFDGDFCTGTIVNSSFSNIKNDAIDFSGSEISIENCSIKNVGDKGISTGENSKITAKNCVISNSTMGAASKDLTHLSLENCKIENCKYGLAAYQKKPEYGPASIETKNCTFKEVNQKSIEDLDSKISIDGKTKIGKKKIDVEKMFY